MISISIEMSVPHSGTDPILEVATWIGAIMSAEPIERMVVHNIRVESGDA